MLLILFFLSLLPEKKTRYLLPILLPAALTMGHLFVYWIRQAKQKMPQLKDRVLYRINAYLIVVAALALPIALYLFMYREGRMGTGMFVWLVVLFLTVAVWLFRSAFKLQPFSFLMGIVALFAVAELFVMPYIRKDLNLRFIDCYDNNRWAKGHKRYDSVFISNVTIVEPIKEQ